MSVISVVLTSISRAELTHAIIYLDKRNILEIKIVSSCSLKNLNSYPTLKLNKLHLHCTSVPKLTRNTWKITNISKRKGRPHHHLQSIARKRSSSKYGYIHVFVSIFTYMFVDIYVKICRTLYHSFILVAPNQPG